MKNYLKLNILVGLPASGKTSFATEEVKTQKNARAIFLDEVKFRHFSKTIEDTIYYGIRDLSGTYDTIYLDGLFLTNDDISNAIYTVAKYFKKVEVEIHRWNEDRETCVKNDGGRRELPSTQTILNATYEEIDLDKINEELKDFDVTIVKITNHIVRLKEDWYRHFKGYSYVDKDGYLRSPKWTTGGAYGNCWDSSLSPVSPEEPLDFDALDELLEGVCPSITFLHYKKIRKECVDTEESYQSEYYGGCTNYLNWRCNLAKMYDILNELGYIKSE